MAVVQVTEQEGSLGGEDNQKGEFTFSRTFFVKTDSVNDGPQVVLSSPLLPAQNEPYQVGYDNDPTAIVNRRSARLVRGHNRYWEVNVFYSSAAETQQGGETNPFDRPPVLNWGFERYQKAIDKDLDDQAIINSAAEPYDPPVEVDDSRPTLTITRAEASFNYTKAIEYQDSVNLDSFYGFEPGQAKIAGITGRGPIKEGDVTYWDVTYEIQFRREGWQLIILDAGFRYYDSSDSDKLKIFKDDQGNPLNQPGLLNGLGDKLYGSKTTIKQQVGVYWEPVEVATPPQYNRFRVYKEKAFGALGLEYPEFFI